MHTFHPDKYIFWKWLLIISGFLFVIFYLEWWLITFSYIPNLNFILIYITGTAINIALFVFILYKPKSVTVNEAYISFKDSKKEKILAWADITSVKFKHIGSRWVFYSTSKPVVYGFDGLDKKDIKLLNQLILENLKTYGFEIKNKFPLTLQKIS